MKRLLLIAYRFPPAQVASSTRLSNFYREALAVFDEVVVLTSDLHDIWTRDPQLEEPPSTTLFKVPTRDHRWWKHHFFPDQSPNSYSKTSKSSGLSSYLALAKESRPFHLLIGDGGMTYIRKGIQKGKELVQKFEITHLFSSYRPLADHQIAARILQDFPHLHWMADFRDLHIDPYRKNVLLAQWQLNRNRKMLTSATCISTVSKSLKRELQTLHPNVHILYNGIGKAHPGPAPHQRDLPTFSYTGSLNEPHLWRAFQRFLGAVQRLSRKHAWNPDQFSFLYRGKDHKEVAKWAATYELLDYCNIGGLESRKKIYGLQARSTVNVLFSWSDPNQSSGILTTKLFEYLAAGRPILAIIDGRKDEEIEKWVEKYGKGTCISDQQEDASIDLWIQKTIEHPPKSLHIHRLPPEAFWENALPQEWVN